MSSQRISVDRELYVMALADAIAWQASILESHDPTNFTSGHCQPGARCEQYQKEAHTLARYTAAQARLRRRAEQART